MPDLSLTKWLQKPIVYVGIWPGTYWPAVEPLLWQGFERCENVATLEDLRMSSFRGISPERLPHVLKNGIDVEPTDSVIFVADLRKALEYGDPTYDVSVVLILKTSHLEPSFKYFARGTTEEEIAVHLSTYPTRIELDDGTIWLTRLKRLNSAGPAYEGVYGRYIPKSARAALTGIILIARTELAAEKFFSETLVKLKTF